MYPFFLQEAKWQCDAKMFHLQSKMVEKMFSEIWVNSQFGTIFSDEICYWNRSINLEATVRNLSPAFHRSK